MGIEADFGHTLFALLGADDDHTVGGTATVDGRTRGILQDLDVVNIICCQKVDILERHTVDHIERIVRTIQRSSTTHANGRRTTWLTIGLRDLQSGSLSLHTLGSRDNRTAFQILGRNTAHGCSHVFTFHGAITDGHHFFQQITVVSQCYFHTV